MMKEEVDDLRDRDLRQGREEKKWACEQNHHQTNKIYKNTLSIWNFFYLSSVTVELYIFFSMKRICFTRNDIYLYTFLCFLLLLLLPWKILFDESCNLQKTVTAAAAELHPKLYYNNHWITQQNAKLVSKYSYNCRNHIFLVFYTKIVLFIKISSYWHAQHTMQFQ